ncbi:uncharacterized protein MEPE_04247 [Melanopsichium pennsylvanicum]|uniref:SAP domain-containing protein n=2 Tax=Melanopsichium pennsylvanicum TaxID=63383 RepID=A0AAJ4XR29_9BASI|nr:putative protein [Melanopsichium pennsylvanicum 4]SNX85538.1 uncharacterized protein MEPE_04247 [Melanopsichium pennsylvanicum]
MLRRIASRTLREPVLRPSSPGPQPTVTSSAVLSYQYQLLQQSRGLVSSVLLSSTRDAYESKKMAELKAELKSRGLAYSGRKEDLIKRLVDHDSYINGSTANMTDAPGARPQLRKKSTLASLRNNDKDGAAKNQTAPPAPTSQSGHAIIKGEYPTSDGGDNKGPVIDKDTAKAVAEANKPLGSMKESETPKDLEPGTVHNAAADGLAGDATAKASPSQEEDGPPKKTTPPGLPPQKAPAAKETFNIQIPYYPDPTVPGAKIPVVTSYTSPHLKQSEEMERESSPFVPRAISVSASSALSHASDMADHADSSKDGQDKKPKGILGEILADLQAANGTGGDKAESALQSVSKGVGAAKSAFNNVAEQAKSAFATASSGSKSGSSSSSSGSGFGSSSSSSSSSGFKQSSNRPLNDQERTGAYVLAGIVTGGFLLGGLGQPSNKSKKDHEHDEKHEQNGGETADPEGQTKVPGAIPVAAVPKGDMAKRSEDVKPSGSSIQAPAGSKTLAPIMCVPKGAQLSSTGAGSVMVNEAGATLARLAKLSACEVRP